MILCDVIWAQEDVYHKKTSIDKSYCKATSTQYYYCVQIRRTTKITYGGTEMTCTSLLYKLHISLFISFPRDTSSKELLLKSELQFKEKVLLCNSESREIKKSSEKRKEKWKKDIAVTPVMSRKWLYYSMWTGKLCR